jgi:multiple sugar transport system permease protein
MSQLTSDARLDTAAAAVRPKARTARIARQSRWTTVIVTVAMGVICFVMLTPTLWTFMAATKLQRDAFASPPHFLYHPSSRVFHRLFQNTEFPHYVLNTAIVGLATAVITLAIAAPAAYALARYGGTPSAAILAFALLIRAVPGFAIALPFYQLATKFGIYDTRIALTMALVAVDQPFTIWLLRNFFAAVPSELDEAALIDGCSRWQAFRRVVLPVTTPGLLTAGILSFLLAFQSYLLPVVLTGPRSLTAPVFLASQIGQALPQLQQAAAGVVVLTLPIIGLAFVAQRYLVAGLTSGAVKG